MKIKTTIVNITNQILVAVYSEYEPFDVGC